MTAVDREAQAIAEGDHFRARRTWKTAARGRSPGQRFDGIVVTNYLHRPLLPVLAQSLAEAAC